MARESKQKRDEKRFGKAERLADKLNHLEAATPSWTLRSEDRASIIQEGKTLFRNLRQSINGCPVIEATSVADYCWHLTKENKPCPTPNPVPPFDRCFVEFHRSQQLVGLIGDGVIDPVLFPASWGFLVKSEDVSALDDGPGPEYRWHISLTMVREMIVPESTGKTVVQGPLYDIHILLRHDGEIGPYKVGPYFPDLADDENLEWVDFDASLMGRMALLAFAFMNQPSIPIAVVEPDRAVNRERRKAGLYPFVRYRTINIGSTNKFKIARDDDSSSGAKKAKHQCRGHWATYTEDKPLFGHFTGTVWKPAHVRGSAKQGVVVSDYNVKAPDPNV